MLGLKSFLNVTSLIHTILFFFLKKKSAIDKVMLVAITSMHAIREVAPNDRGLFLSQGLCRNGCY